MSTLRVATYNLYLGADLTVVFDARDEADLAVRARVVLDQLLATDFAARAQVVAGLMARERVDVVGLQEVARWSWDGAEEPWLDFLDELLAALSRAGAAYDAHAATTSFEGGAQVAGGGAMSVLGRNVVLVRRDSGVRVLGSASGSFRRTLEVVTPMPGLVLGIARSWSRLEAELAGRRFWFVNTHLEAWDAQIRDAQRGELLGELRDAQRDEPGGHEPVVVVGDFNAAPAEVGMPAEYVDAWAVAGTGGPGRTCGQAADLRGDSALATRIDYVFARGPRVERCWVVGDREQDRTPGGLWPSDHACVVADLELG